LVGPIRFELMTSRLSSVRSNQLSYGPIGRIDQIPASRPKAKTQGPSWARDRPIVLKPSCEGRPMRSGKRNEDGGDPLICIIGASIEPKFWRSILRKEVIQPQVPLRLPCYDFTPVADPTVVAYLPCGLAQRLRVEPTPMV
jgi:hypothetical protein